jgi:predicted nucleic acid-binding protein
MRSFEVALLKSRPMSCPVHATCFDASALVKRYLDEPGSPALRQYWNGQPTRYTTPFCLYETLGVLKGRMRNGKMTKAAYFKAATDLVAWFRVSHSQVNDLDFTDRDVFSDARELAERHDLDLSDAFQLLSLQAGYFSGLVGDSTTVLVTADEALAKAARHMQLAVWDCLREPMPDT